MAASATNCALEHTWNPHVDCSMQHGHDSAFEPGAYGLPYYCTPPVCVPVVLGGLSVWPCHYEPASAMPENVNVAKPPNKEKSYKKYLESTCSDQGGNMLRLHSVTHQGECEHTYTGISITNTSAACISQPHTSPTHPAPPTSPPQVLKKGLKGWITEATPLCCSAHACHLPTSSCCGFVL